MPNEFDEEFAPDLRAIFDAYPQPAADAAFDARFWRELESRRNRYRGPLGLARRLVEIEIEGIALWRLGFALFGGAATCAVGVALLSLSASPAAPSAPTQIAATRVDATGADALDRALSSPRYASGLWDDAPPARAPKSPPAPARKEVLSWVSSARGLV